MDSSECLPWQIHFYLNWTSPLTVRPKLYWTSSDDVFVGKREVAFRKIKTSIRVFWQMADATGSSSSSSAVKPQSTTNSKTLKQSANNSSSKRFVLSSQKYKLFHFMMNIVSIIECIWLILLCFFILMVWLRIQKELAEIRLFFKKKESGWIIQQGLNDGSNKIDMFLCGWQVWIHRVTAVQDRKATISMNGFRQSWGLLDHLMLVVCSS